MEMVRKMKPGGNITRALRSEAFCDRSSGRYGQLRVQKSSTRWAGKQEFRCSDFGGRLLAAEGEGGEGQ